MIKNHFASFSKAPQRGAFTFSFALSGFYNCLYSNGSPAYYARLHDLEYECFQSGRSFVYYDYLCNWYAITFTAPLLNCFTWVVNRINCPLLQSLLHFTSSLLPITSSLPPNKKALYGNKGLLPLLTSMRSLQDSGFVTCQNQFAIRNELESEYYCALSNIYRNEKNSFTGRNGGLSFNWAKQARP